jgi:hypothetical protein
MLKKKGIPFFLGHLDMPLNQVYNELAYQMLLKAKSFIISDVPQWSNELRICFISLTLRYMSYIVQEVSSEPNLQ